MYFVSRFKEKKNRMAESNSDQWEWVHGYEFKRTVGPYPKEYECAICLSLIRNCVNVPCKVGHFLCKSCLDGWEINAIGKDEEDNFVLKNPKKTEKKNEETKDTEAEDDKKYHYFIQLIYFCGRNRLPRI